MKTPIIKGNRGFTLIEILIALALMTIITTAIYQLYISQYKTWVSQDIVTELQQSGRFAMDTMTREMHIMGYDLPAGQDAITDATATTFTFRSRNTSITSGEQRKQISFRLNGNKIEMAETTWDGTFPAINSSDYRTLAEGITSTTLFAYYDDSGNAAATYDDIRRINISFTVQTSRKDPVTNRYKSMTLATVIRPRNLGIGETLTDLMPPAVPADIEVIDPGTCGTLRLKWTANLEIDLAGYTIYYSTTSRSNPGFTGYRQVKVGTSAANGYNLTGLTTTMSGDATPTIYYITVDAYDKSGNHSQITTSPEVSGDPDPNTRDFGDVPSNGSDTTVDTIKPAPPTNFVAADGGNTTVALTWTPSADSNVVGYRLYRSSQPFASFPLTQGGDVVWLAGAPDEGRPDTLNSSANSYTDDDSALIGCRTYYYAIAPVTCDTTLVSATDAVENGNSTKYVVTDYAGTCGDGTNSCTPGTGFAAVNGSDTSPNETTVPSAPGFGVRAGWKRVAVSFTQPTNSDLDQTCIYVNQGASWPGIQTDTGSYPLVSGCYQVTTGKLIPDSGGIFTAAEVATGQSTSFWHDDWNVETPPGEEPNLAETGTYSYRAVSFDLCGNASALAGAQATTILCGQDPPLCSVDPTNPNCQADPGNPPAVSNFSASCCGTSSAEPTDVNLIWTGVPSNLLDSSTENNPWDLAGYRIFRSMGDPTCTNWDSATLLNTSTPWWGTPYGDTAPAAGSTYCYRIVTTDCPYERTVTSATAEAQIRTDMKTGSPLKSVIFGPVYPGEILRDEKCTTAEGTCTPDKHMAVLTGVTVDMADGSGNGSTSPSSSFSHNTVTMFLENTSAGTMTIQKATVEWVNTLAYLRGISIGGGRTGMTEQTTSIAAASTGTVTDAPYTRGVNEYVVSNGTVLGLKRYVPVTFTFKDVDGNPVDMRGDQLRVTLKIKNESTGVTTCVSYLTITEPQAEGGIYVPLGPSVSGVQQNEPVSPTDPYVVPGGGATANTVPTDSSYADIQVPATVDVTVSASVESRTIDVTDGNPLAISSVKLYWAETSQLTGSAPAIGWSTVTMSFDSGSTWTGDIPQTGNNFRRIWYYIVSEDSDGNYDRSPAINAGYYTYDKIADPCEDTPNATTASLLNSPNVDVVGTNASPGVNVTTTGSGGAGSVNISWTAVTTNTDATTIWDLVGYKVYVMASSNKGQTWSSWSVLPTGTVLKPTTTFSYDPTDTDGTWLKYYVTPYDKCTDPSPIENPSNILGPVIKGTCSAAPAVPTALAITAPASPRTNDVDASGNVTLTWSDADAGKDVDYYNVYVSTNGTTWLASVGSPTTTSFTYAPSQADGTNLWYSVSAHDYCGIESAKTAAVGPVYKGTCSAGVSAVTGFMNDLTTANGAADSDVRISGSTAYVDLHWNANTDFDFVSYAIDRSVDGAAYTAITTITTASTTSYSDSFGKTAMDGKVLTYRITVTDKCGNTAATTTNVYPSGCAAGNPATPATPTVTNSPNTLDKLTGSVPDGSVGLSWARNAEFDIDHYNVYRSVNASAYNLLAATAPQVAAGNVTYTNSLSGLNEGDTVSYKVAAVDNCSSGVHTSALSGNTTPLVTKSCSVPPTASTLSVTNSTVDALYSNSYDMPDGQVKLSWTANGNGDFASFDIYRQINAGAWSVSLFGTTSAAAGSYTDPAPGGSEGDTITYKIVTTDKCGVTSQSTVSVIKSCTTTPATPAGLNLTNSPTIDVDGSGNVNLSWTANTEADLVGYKIYESVSTDNGVTWSAYTNIATVAKPGTTYARSTAGLNAGDRMAYAITSYDQCGKESAQSLPIGVVVKGTCSVNPTAQDMYNLTVNCPSACYLNTFQFDIPADGDFKGVNLYSNDGTFDATSNVGYTLRSTITISGGSCSATSGSCSIAGSTVTVTAPTGTSWEWTSYWSIRTYDQCGLEGDRLAVH